MARDLITCPLCGFEFSRSDTLCHHGCPLAAGCPLVRCPNCEYEYPERPAGGSWIVRLLRGGSDRTRCLPEGARSVGELAPGERASVVCLGSPRGPRERALTLFGLAPGAEVEVLQQRPACVLRIGETELALDREIARHILVEPSSMQR